MLKWLRAGARLWQVVIGGVEMEVGDLVRRSRGWLERRQSELHGLAGDFAMTEELLMSREAAASGGES